MKLTNCEKKDNKIAELTVMVTPEEFDKALNESFIKNKGQVAVPGFRKGKAPRKIIEKMYGASIFYNDALDILLPSVCTTGIKESELQTVGYPQILDVNFGDDKSATIKFSIELYPEVTLGDYKGLKAVRPAATVDEANIDSEIAAVQLRNARIQTTTRPAMNGDTAIIDFEGFVDGVAFDGGKGEDYELALGSNSFIPGFEAKMNGMTTGEERDLDLVFPADYKEDLAGKPVLFKVKLKELKEKILPELDDEFAKDVSEFDTMVDYKNDIRAKLAVTKEKEAEAAFENAVLSKLGEGISCEVPEAMISDHLDNQMENFRRQLSSYGMELPMYLNMMGTNEEGFRTNMRPDAIKQIQVTLALEKVAEVEKLEATEEEIETYFTDMATKYGVEVAMVKESVSTETAVRELKMRAASKFVTDNAIAEAPSEETSENEPAVTEKKTKKSKAAEKVAETTDEASEAEAAAPTATEKKTAPKKTAAKSKATKTDNGIDE